MIISDKGRFSLEYGMELFIFNADGKSPSGLIFFEVVDCNNAMLIYNPEGVKHE